VNDVQTLALCFFGYAVLDLVGTILTRRSFDRLQARVIELEEDMSDEVESIDVSVVRSISNLDRQLQDNVDLARRLECALDRLQDESRRTDRESKEAIALLRNARIVFDPLDQVGGAELRPASKGGDA
jgi:hypothetical protein